MLTGECPGGLYNAYLMIEKRGEIYAKDHAGNLILPIFQVAAHDAPALNNLGAEPEFSKDPLWKCYQ
jgi:hypothetical protein